MSRVSDVSTDCGRKDPCSEFAARVFGSLGLPGVNVLAALAEDFSRRRAAAGRADAASDRCRPMARHVTIRTVAEVSLSEALSDPIVRSLMAADRVDPAELEESLDEVARKLAHRRANGTAG